MSYADSKAKEDAWFKKVGQELPEVNLHLTEEERENYRKQALEGHTCDYFQQGNRIICQEGENEHGKIIDIMKHRLVGTKDNIPQFAKYDITVVK